jgi:hypothetical protein
MYNALKYVLLDGVVYYKMIEGIQLKCLDEDEDEDEAKLAMSKVHEGICGTHQ